MDSETENSGKLWLFMFDWDDTLCPTTSIYVNNRIDNIDKLETIVCQTLEKALKFGQIVIVTNADEGWVEESSEKYMPLVFNFLNTHKIKIISAKTTYKSLDLPISEWKTKAFEDEIKLQLDLALQKYSTLEVHLLSFGDALFERNALITCSKTHPYLINNSSICHYVKMIKFIEKPNCTQLLKQHMLLNKNTIEELAHANTHLDMQIQFQN
jgi:hypothetical protein